MLKALELYGFKSFAERTRFEFPAGITVVVGPNGSGKSNVVDAMKWVLGEQSVKSLRGKEMSDVIFKGSGDGRKAMNSAEATIVFDNSTGHLPYDAPEVHVTRRVYRSGEGEYLINNQACRLRDIKDMFRGSGVGTDAYSIIEQGKLDVLVSASAKERRTIFEEAAGISRFKAKKVEAQRRLERVEQNMLRLSDIVEEVDSRLRTVRAQAGKAQRYKEYSDRLQQLRTQVGLTDWRKLTESLESLDAEATVLREEIASANAESQQLEASAQEVEAKFLEADEAIRSLQSQLARNRESIAADESTCDHHASRVKDLEEEANHCRSRVAAAGAKAGDLHARVSDTVKELEQAEEEHRQVAGSLAELERQISDLDQRGETLRNASEARRIDFMKAMRDSATLGNRLSAGESQLETASATAKRRRATFEELTAAAEEALQEIEQLNEQSQRLAADVETGAAELAEAVKALTELRRVRSEASASLSKLENKQAGLAERIALLAELEERREGVDAGAMQLLGGSQAGVHGLVADLLQVNVEIAPLIDAALGEAAQFVVIEGESRYQELIQRPPQSGRVGLVRLEDSAVRRAPVDVSQEEGVIGRADQLIETARRYRPLFERLLGDAWVVESLEVANRLWHEYAGQLRLITAGGTMITRAGAAVLGSPSGASGLISRRSELRFLEADLEALDAEVEQQQARVADLAGQIAQQQAANTRLDELQRERTAALTQQRGQISTAQQRREQLLVGRDAAQQELAVAEQQQETLTSELGSLRQEIEQAELHLSDMEQGIHADRRELGEIETQRTTQQAEATGTKVLLAKCEQRLENLRTRLEQFEEDRRERTRAIVDARRQLTLCFERRDQAELEILHTTSRIALLYLEKERIAAQASELQQSRKKFSSERTALLEAATDLRNSLRKREDKLHKKDMAAGELKLQRTALEDRLREDYGLEISELVQQAQSEDEEQRLALEEEIADLRRKISNIGAVNLDALQELDELDQRYSSLSGQHEDLVKAKEALVRIINKINTDSRRLFTETLEIIRQNFQRIFRKLFGGGKADILLEPGVDELEAGVEIVANPPGKQALSMSLLSGGERALCAVSLLMAIFEFRPSPFCVLDEVDGPLDEANIGRFVDQLRDFLGWTKFVIVTHSKKTMTAATTLYGVTMQESGISKRVSVKFEDVSETGHISQEAVEREEQAADDGQAA